jgi:hypothetical protein
MVDLTAVFNYFIVSGRYPSTNHVRLFDFEVEHYSEVDEGWLDGWIQTMQERNIRFDDAHGVQFGGYASDEDTTVSGGMPDEVMAELMKPYVVTQTPSSRNTQLFSWIVLMNP